MQKRKSIKYLLTWDEYISPCAAKWNIECLRDHGVQVDVDDEEMRELKAKERYSITFTIATASKKKFIDVLDAITIFRGDVLGEIIKFIFDGKDYNPNNEALDWDCVERKAYVKNNSNIR